MNSMIFQRKMDWNTCFINLKYLQPVLSGQWEAKNVKNSQSE